MGALGGLVSCQSWEVGASWPLTPCAWQTQAEAPHPQLADRVRLVSRLLSDTLKDTEMRGHSRQISATKGFQ